MIMLRFAIGCLILILVAGNAAAQTNTDYYLGAYAGVTSLVTANARDSFGLFNLEATEGSLIAVSIGYELPPLRHESNGRVEIEYSQRSANFNQAEFTNGKVSASGSLEVQSLMFNSFVVFPTRTRFSPYVGLGIGGAIINVDNLVVAGFPMVNDDNFSFAWQVGGGMEFTLTQSLRMDLGYRFFSTNHTDFVQVDGSKIEIEGHSHNGMLGLVWLF